MEQQLTDVELIAGLNSESPDIFFELLYDKFSPALYGLALKIFKDESVASKILEDSMVKSYRKRKNYNYETSLLGWMINILINTAHDYILANPEIAKSLGVFTPTEMRRFIAQLILHK